MRKLVCLILCMVGLSLSSPIKNEKRTKTLIISLSGFRADRLDEFLDYNHMSFMKREFVDTGVKAKYMIPSFPSNIFPNMFSMISGKYPENHGVIGDKFYDLKNKRLLLLSPSRYDLNAKYWNKSQPFWLGEESRDVKIGSSFWPGSEILGREPDLFLNYDKNYTFLERSHDIVNWFEKFDLDLGLFSVNEPYQTGLTYGPESNEYMRKIEELDQQLGLLFLKLEQVGLLESMNVIVVGDAGMATFKNTILFKDLLDESLINFNITAYDVVAQIRPKSDDLDTKKTVYEKLRASKNMKVFYKEDVPDYLHFNKDNNIAPIVVIANEGYTINRYRVSNIKGINGYDNSLESMRTIFMARGPDFNENVEIEPFSNLDIHSLICLLMRVNCKESDANPTNKFAGALKKSSMLQIETSTRLPQAMNENKDENASIRHLNSVNCLIASLLSLLVFLLF